VFNNLDYYGIVGLDLESNKTKKFLPQSATGVTWTNEWFNRSSDALSDKFVLNTENRLIFNKSFTDRHKLTLAGIFQTREQKSAEYASQTAGNASSSISDPITSVNIMGMGSGKSVSRELGAFFNGQYAYNDKYMLNLGYRIEANSSLAAKNRFGGFPTIGFAWQIGDEKFIKNLKLITLAKLRLSWGQSGNSPGGSYPYIGIFEPAQLDGSNINYINMSAVGPTSIELENLKWETVTQYNAGLDLSLFDSQLSFALDVYYKLTTDLLQKDVKLPSSTGFGKVKYFNSGEMSNRGWEFRVDWDVFKGKDYGILFNFNIAQNINKIISLPDNLLSSDYTFNNGEYASRVVSGDPLGSFYGYKCLGVYQNIVDTYAKDSNGNTITDMGGNSVIMKNGSLAVNPGDAKYKDMNNDGVINQYDIVYLGNALPTMTGGFGINLRYKNLGLIAYFHGRLGQKIVNIARMNMENMRSTANQSTAVLKRWRHEGDDTNIPRALYGRGYNYLGSDRFVEDGSFLRMKTLTLKYSLPKLFLQKLSLTKVDLYVTTYDLWTITGYTGQDPEVGLSDEIYMLAVDKAVTPKPIRLAFGILLNF
jgi:TonB-linked SusC/RagA family outer membrane protein